MKKLKYLVLILMILVFLSGLGVLLYPYIRGYLVDRQIERTAEEFLSRVETDPISPYPSESQLDQDTPSDSPEPTEPDTYTDLWRDMVDYNKEIYINGQKGLDCKLAYEDPSFVLADYGLESEVFAVISIPALELEMPVFLGANYRHMADGAALLGQTSIPIGGKNTNCIIAGHRGWGGASYFRYVDKLQPGDEVIVPAYTYCASAIPFGDLGAHIVWADINKDTWTIDPDDFERKITPKTKAVVAVHLLGIPCDMKRIVAIARRHGIKVVEDCYNAAPDSMNAALDTLSGMECEGRKICVFADMRELGSASDESHRAIGQHAARVADKLLVYGPQSHLYVEGANAAGLSDAREYPDRPALTQAVREAVRPGDIVWFKGSLLMNLEEVLRAVFPDAE